ncbi:6231_t:CDS:2, partial [Ambispora gerdemannii]
GILIFKRKARQLVVEMNELVITTNQESNDPDLVTIDSSFVTSPYTHEFKKDENGKYIFMIGEFLQQMVQRKVQQELDGIVGKGRLYTMNHYADLNYLKVTIEDLGINLSLPHCSSQDELIMDTYFRKYWNSNQFQCDSLQPSTS